MKELDTTVFDFAEGLSQNHTPPLHHHFLNEIGYVS